MSTGIIVVTVFVVIFIIFMYALVKVASDFDDKNGMGDD